MIETESSTLRRVTPVLGYLSLSQDEAAFVEALVNSMCPSDEFTPPGVDCGLAAYIDRQLFAQACFADPIYGVGKVFWMQTLK